MPRQYINELSDGETVEETYLLTEKQLRANRNADLYLLAKLRDRTGALHGLMWNVTEDSMSNINAGDYVFVKGKVQLFQGSLQLIITRIQSVSPDMIDIADFQQAPSQEVETLLNRLREILLAIEDQPLRVLMECFLSDEELMQSFAQAPAGVKAHHAYPGGLLEHVVNIMETAQRIIDLYPGVDFNLLTAGIFLHDFGKVRELVSEPSLLYTDEGQLIGHLVIAIGILDEKINEANQLLGEPFPEEAALRLKHMIVSHHGQYEFGSPKLPMTPEAVVLHHLDNIDAKVHEFVHAIEDDPNSDSHWTAYSQRLGRKLFKGSRQKQE